MEFPFLSIFSAQVYPGLYALGALTSLAYSIITDTCAIPICQMVELISVAMSEHEGAGLPNSE